LFKALAIVAVLITGPGPKSKSLGGSPTFAILLLVIVSSI